MTTPESPEDRKEWMAAVGEALYGYIATSRLMRHNNGASTAYYIADQTFPNEAMNFVCDVVAWAGPKAARRPGAVERVMAAVEIDIADVMDAAADLTARETEAVAS